MATFLQLLSNSRLIKQVVIIAGRNAFVRRLALEEIIGRWGADHVDYFHAPFDSTDDVLLRLAEPIMFDARQSVVFEDIQEAQHLQQLEKYLNNPTRGLQLIFTAIDKTAKDGKRWIPSDDRVLYVDCTTMTEDHLLKLAMARGLCQDDADWLVEACAGDISELSRVLDLLSIFEKPWESSLVRSLVPTIKRSGDKLTAKLSIHDTGNTQSLFWNLHRRFRQLISISSVARPGRFLDKDAVAELARRVDVDPFIIIRLLPVAKSATPLVWMERLATLAEVDRFMREDEFREYLLGKLA